MNLYGFAAGDPVNFSDPFGLCPPKTIAEVLQCIGQLLRPAQGPLEIAGTVATLPLSGAFAVEGIGAEAVMIGRAFRTASATGAWGNAVFEATEQGGAHAGFLRNYAARGGAEHARATRSLEKTISEHEGFLENPASHVENWENLRPQHQQSLIRHWRNEIRTATEQIEILKRIQ